jgi:hypothetical protein
MAFNVDNLSIILNYSLSDETTHFEEEHDVELPEDTSAAIAMIEELEETDHILYNLLLLSKEIKEQ